MADARLLRNLPLILLSSIAMGAVLWFANLELTPWLQPKAGVLVQVGTLAGLVALGLLAYALAVQITGVADWRVVLRQFRSRRGRPAVATDE